MSKCRTCGYFIPITDDRESYGLCTWFDYNDIPALPYWSTVITKYGSISPYGGKNCQVYDAEANLAELSVNSEG